MPIMSNKKGGKLIVKSLASETITVASMQSAGETLNGVAITHLNWTGGWTVARGANTVLSLTDGQDTWEFDGDYAISEWPAADLTITRVSANGTLILTLNKKTSDEL